MIPSPRAWSFTRLHAGTGQAGGYGRATEERGQAGPGRPQPLPLGGQGSLGSLRERRAALLPWSTNRATNGGSSSATFSLRSVSSCKTGREAALTVAACIQKTLHVKYSTERRVPHQGVKESLESGKVSCTGQSILLICALRSIGIPARMGGRGHLEPRPGQPQLGGSLVRRRMADAGVQ